MNNDQRLDRLERILTLIVRAGRRTRAGIREETRRSVNEADGKVSILISSQIKTDDEIKKLTANIKDLTEESKTMREDSKAMREDSKTMREDSKAMREELTAMREESNAKREDIRAMREEAVAMRDDLYQRSRDVFELFHLTDQKIARLTEVQTAMGQQLAGLIDHLGTR